MACAGIRLGGATGKGVGGEGWTAVDLAGEGRWRGTGGTVGPGFNSMWDRRVLQIRNWMGVEAARRVCVVNAVQTVGLGVGSHAGSRG